MRTCPTCQQKYSDDMEYCSRDATPLPPVVPATQFDLALGLSGRYRVLRRLGAGGMGTVFLAEQLTVGSRAVALKILRRTLLEDPEFLQRFRDEAASTGRIHHQNVVTVYECGQTDDGSPYIAMEYLEGESLRQYLQREGSIPLDRTADILQQAARGLNAAHKLGIIHRDLKPDNIFLTQDDDGKLLVKIVDFGIAKMRESTTHTMTGLAVGTPTYMSVEQASGMRSEEIDGRSDIYSLGIVVYEMLAGTVPFRADTPLAYVQKHLTEPPAALSLARPDLNIPPQVEAAVMKALNKDRQDRYATAPEFARAFAGATGAAAITTPIVTPGAVSTPVVTAIPTPDNTPLTAPVQKQGSPLSKAVLAVGGIVVLLAVCAAGLYVMRGKSESKQVASPDRTASAINNTQPLTPASQPQSAPPTPTAPVPQTRPPQKSTAPAVSLDRAIELLKTHSYGEALPPIKQFAANGNPEAERYLADMYRNGWGVRQDDGQARHWYEKAAAAGNVAAFADLGHIYDYGWGVPQDYGQARSWYEKAASAGNATAMVDLGRFYERGLGVQQDHARAREWYEKAAAAGNTNAERDLARLSQEEKAGQDRARPVQNAAGSTTRTPSPEASALFQKARAEWQRGDRGVAVADMNSAISNSPFWPAAYLFRAHWESEMGDTKAALADYTACIERQPVKANLVSALLGRAKVRDRLGDTTGAETDREQAHRIQNDIQNRK